MARASFHPLVDPALFVSHKLSNKLEQQAKCVLSVCGKGVPRRWRRLVHTLPFLFTHQSRCLLFRVTAFNPARHWLSLERHLAAVQAAGGRGTEAAAAQRTAHWRGDGESALNLASRRVPQLTVKVERSRGVLASV